MIVSHLDCYKNGGFVLEAYRKHDKSKRDQRCGAANFAAALCLAMMNEAIPLLWSHRYRRLLGKLVGNAENTLWKRFSWPQQQ
jgi:hypothetical protein